MYALGVLENGKTRVVARGDSRTARCVTPQLTNKHVYLLDFIPDLGYRSLPQLESALKPGPA